MKILMVIPAIGPSYGGTSKCVLELAQALVQQGLHVDILTTNADGDKQLDVPLGQWVIQHNYRVLYFPYWNFSDYKISFSLVRWLWRHVNQYDLIHAHAIFSFSVTASHWICHWHSRPYLVTPHGMLEPWALSYKAWKKRLYYHLLERPALENASAIHVLANKEVNSVQRLKLDTEIVKVNNGIHTNDFRELPSPNVFFNRFPDTRGKELVLFLGRIDPKKGLDLLAQAFSKVNSLFPNTHLIIAGGDSINFLPTAKSYFSEANCLDSVTFTGMLTGNLKYGALAAANFYVAPSYSEGFSMSVLEGMASGLPCVITTACNFPEAKTAKAAHVVDVDADAIAYALITCLKNPVEAREIGDRARQFILENYTWDKIASNLVPTYEAIINKKPLPHLYD